MKRGDTITTTCKTCPTTITYVLRGRHILYCPECRKANINIQAKRHYDATAHRTKLAAGEAAAYHIDGLASVTCMTQDECAAKLAVWESMEAKIKTGRFKFIRPISRQRVQQIERKVLVIMRRALAPDYREWKEEMGEPVKLK